MQTELDYFLLDVFTDIPFGGNPLAVFPEADGLSDEAMQKITKELNLSETVFLLKPKQENSDISMRIFTPGRELPTAGHPTIGTAFLLLASSMIKTKLANTLVIDQKIGSINVQYFKNEAEETEVLMEQPLPKFEQTFKDKELIASLIGIRSSELYESYPARVVNCGNPFLLVPVKELKSMQKLKLNQDLYYNILEELSLTGVMPFSLETVEKESIAHSRMFAPQLGITEDPATGSAHGPLAAYLHNYQLAKVNGLQQCEQGIEMGRPSFINIKIEEKEGKLHKVLVGGKCVIMGKGTLYHSV